MDGKKHDLVDLMGITMSKIREMVDVNTIVGEAINTPDGTTIIPVSRLSFGFGSGGSDYGKETKSFAGGSGAGVNITPIGFLIIGRNGVKMLPVGVPPATTAERVIEMVPVLMEKVEGYFEDRKKGRDEEAF